MQFFLSSLNSSSLISLFPPLFFSFPLFLILMLNRTVFSHLLQRSTLSWINVFEPETGVKHAELFYSPVSKHLFHTIINKRPRLVIKCCISFQVIRILISSLKKCGSGYATVLSIRIRSRYFGWLRIREVLKMCFFFSPASKTDFYYWWVILRWNWASRRFSGYLSWDLGDPTPKLYFFLSWI